MMRAPEQKQHHATGNVGNPLLLLGLVFLSAVGARCAVAPLWAHDPTHSGGKQFDLALDYTPHDIKYVMWGGRLVEAERGVYGTVGHTGLHYGYGPTLAYLTWAWQKVFGPSVVSTKFLCVAGDVLVLALLYLLLGRLCGGRAAMVGLVFYAFSASSMHTGSVRGKEDVVAMAFLVLAVLFLASPGRPAAVLAAAAAALSYTSKPLLIFAAVPIGIHLCQRGGLRRVLVFAGVFVALTGLLVSVEWARSDFVACSPAHLGEQTRHVGGISLFLLPGKIAEIHGSFPGKTLCKRLDGLFREHPVDMPILAALYVLCVWLLWRRNRANPDILLLKGCAVGLLLAGTARTSIWPQYHYWAVPFVIVLAAMDLKGRALRGYARPVVGAVLVTIAVFWFAATWEQHAKHRPPDVRNALFLALMVVGTMLVVPGWTGRGLALIATGSFLFDLGPIDWRPYLGGARDYRLSRAVNRILAVSLYYGGALILLLRLLRRCVEGPVEAEPRPAGRAGV